VGGRLRRSDLAGDPFEVFRAWFDHAREAGQPEPEAMALATAGADGNPDVRFVLMRGFDSRGLVFYTNRRSTKGRQLSARPRAAAAFRWDRVDRQVRVAGAVSVAGEDESDAYFASRPRASQLSAWASDQSRPATGLAELEARLAEVEQRFAGRPVPRPRWWGGYRIEPEVFEFWQEGEFRTHDRFRYRRAGEGAWEVSRLHP
jgi:pyridoxamine 5'-phosphate oxidase